MHHIVSQDEDCHAFFRDYVSAERKVLCIATLGFNDICLHFPTVLAAYPNVDYLFLVEERPEVSDVLRRAAARNREVLLAALSGHQVSFEPVQIVADDTANVAGRRAAQACARVLNAGYSDIVVDASSMSRGVCFPVVKYVFELSKREGRAQAHVVGAGRDQPTIKVTSTSSDAPQYVHGFQADMSTDVVRKAIKLWIPQLSENAITSLSRIQRALEPDESCPILPFPSWDPCRGDRLLREFQLPILGEWNVNLLDVIYAHEADPMDVCISIMRIHRSREEALAVSTPLPARTILSPSGTRIGSVGMLLAAMALNLPIMYEESIGYSSSLSSVPPLSENPPEHLWHVWLKP